jgi:hypothetical protein
MTIEAEARHCENCGDPLKYGQKRFCSNKCRLEGVKKASDIANGPPRYCENPDCRKILTRWKKVHCCIECREIRKNNKPLYKTKEKSEVFMVDCKCPTCGEMRQHEFLYEPTIMPRIYCENHINNRNMSESGFDDCLDGVWR